jgi:hypothetical protein
MIFTKKAARALPGKRVRLRNGEILVCPPIFHENRGDWILFGSKDIGIFANILQFSAYDARDIVEVMQDEGVTE